jgi:hypothetical protein
VSEDRPATISGISGAPVRTRPTFKFMVCSPQEGVAGEAQRLGKNPPTTDLVRFPGEKPGSIVLAHEPAIFGKALQSREHSRQQSHGSRLSPGQRAQKLPIFHLDLDFLPSLAAQPAVRSRPARRVTPGFPAVVTHSTDYVSHLSSSRRHGAAEAM